MGPDGGQGYSSPHLLTIQGVPQVVLLDAKGAVSVSPTDGAELWKVVVTSSGMSAPVVQPALTADGDVLVTAGDISGAAPLRGRPCSANGVVMPEASLASRRWRAGVRSESTWSSRSRTRCRDRSRSRDRSLSRTRRHRPASASTTGSAGTRGAGGSTIRMTARTPAAWCARTARSTAWHSDVRAASLRSAPATVRSSTPWDCYYWLPSSFPLIGSIAKSQINPNHPDRQITRSPNEKGHHPCG